MTTPAQQEIVDRLVDAAIAYFPGITREAVYGRDRTVQVTACRAAVAYTLMRADWTPTAIARILNRDRATVYHLVKRHERGAYRGAMLTVPTAVSAPRDIGSLIERVLNLELTVQRLTERLEVLEANAVTRRIGRAS